MSQILLPSALDPCRGGKLVADAYDEPQLPCSLGTVSIGICMKNFLPSLAVIALSTAACTTETADYTRAPLGAKVYPLEDGVFEVVAHTGGNGFEYWCAAADYARRTLGASWQAPVYIYRGLAPGEASGRRSTVLFTLNPVVSQVPQSGVRLTNAFYVGDTMTVQAGNSQCIMELIEV